MKEENLNKHIDFNIEQNTLLLLFETLSFMSKNYHVAGVVDHAAWIISKQDVDDTLKNLIPFLNSEKIVVKVKMNLQEWHRYVRLVDYAGFSAPQQKSRKILENLYDRYSDWENSKDFGNRTYSKLSNEEKIKISMKDHIDLLDKLADF
ncbi:hypothetical protein FF125_07890 [Aureibaculum algae]|uniref:Uncharacterized protein n=1 Tax=Aureibaculum algae TaxID=2584122 RepID=A0A5B7TTE1_9FLAO|nr:hypothetical protein [Aureibaculum algae]QCX38356.1 hypothetical protein FF125_07890 [Aureibaculum algae]